MKQLYVINIVHVHTEHVHRYYQLLDMVSQLG